MLKRVNEETLRQLRHTQDEGNQGASGKGQQVSEVVAYRSIAEMPTVRDLAIQASMLASAHHEHASCKARALPEASSHAFALQSSCYVHKFVHISWECIPQYVTLICMLSCKSLPCAHMHACFATQECMVSACRVDMQVDQKREAVLVPIYGVMVPFHILTIKNATNNQEGEHSYIRLIFNFGQSFEPGARYPKAVFLKELSFRTSDTRHALKVVQEIKVLRSSVSQREKEQAERATLVQQERLIKSKVACHASLYTQLVACVVH